MATEPAKDVKKIVILRALVLGDLIFILPALQSLRSTFPNAEITYIGRPWAVSFLRNRLPAVDRVIGIHSSPTDFEDIGFLIHPEEAAGFFEQMQAESFDLAFQMQGGGKNSNPFLRRLGARINIGSREVGAAPLDRWLPYDYYQHDVIRNLELVGLAGAQPAGWTPCLPVLASDLEAAEPFLSSVNGPFLVIHPGARDIRRCWPPEKFARVADAFQQKYGLQVVITGSEVDDDVASTVQQAMQGDVHNFSHQLSLQELTALLSRAALIISNDTGVLHTGLAVGAPAVGLYWGEYISKSLPLSRQRFSPVIAWERHCPLCGKFLDFHEVVRADPRPCMHQVSFLDEIEPEQVLETGERLLGQWS